MTYLQLCYRQHNKSDLERLFFFKKILFDPSFHFKLHWHCFLVVNKISRQNKYSFCTYLWMHLLLLNIERNTYLAVFCSVLITEAQGIVWYSESPNNHRKKIEMCPEVIRCFSFLSTIYISLHLNYLPCSPSFIYVH